MKVLVTGGAGFVGTNVIKQLIKDEHEVISFDNYSSGFTMNHQKGCDYYNVNLTNEKSLFKLLKETKPEVIFHMAALSRIQPSIKFPEYTIKNNLNSTLNILEYCRKNKSQLIFSGSSSYHFGIHKSPYAWSKYGSEELCKLYSKRYNVNSLICRFYNVYGPHEIKRGEYATIIGIFRNQYENNLPLTIVGNGEQRRDFVHVKDVVRALLLSMKEEFRGEILELGTGTNHSMNEIANMFGEDYPRINIPTRPGEYDKTLCDYSFAKEILEWVPRETLKEYIKKKKEFVDAKKIKIKFREDNII